MRRRPPRSSAPAAATPDWRSYDSVAETYERVRAPLHADPAADLVRLMELPPGGRVLDVGTGPGVAAELAGEEVGAEGLVVGVDPSIGMLRTAIRRVPHVIQAQALDLPFRDGVFDGVIATFVVFFFRRYETGLAELSRVLRPGAELGLTTWGGGDDAFAATWREIAEAYVGRDLLRDATRQAAPWEEHFSDPGRVKETLRDAGFRNVRVEVRTYRHTVSLEDYIAGRETSVTGRFLRGMLGEALWARFHARVTEEFRNRFPDPIGDSNDVLLTLARKP